MSRKTIDHIPPNFKLWHCKNGKDYVAPDTACMFCKHCDEIIYDFTNGPYLFCCVVGGDTDKAFDKDVRCELFESEEENDSK